ncbi:hypothetical protein K7711_09995 [Nocardia sp. CA2R105]|uniref:hypothetical protein n=1 Tax=Nocardia coffeae TaxID=2873381 RepID=UPI001CA61722|nr:hypothetical protein [Nocardia coffeae]MBY8856807.1 hypothetical protein [Nocardia coffeae]
MLDHPGVLSCARTGSTAEGLTAHYLTNSVRTAAAGARGAGERAVGVHGAQYAGTDLAQLFRLSLGRRVEDQAANLGDVAGAVATIVSQPSSVRLARCDGRRTDYTLD